MAWRLLPSQLAGIGQVCYLTNRPKCCMAWCVERVGVCHRALGGPRACLRPGRTRTAWDKWLNHCLVFHRLCAPEGCRFISIRTFCRSCLAIIDDEPVVNRPFTILMFLRLLVSLLGQLLHTTGFWTLLDLYTFDNTPGRNFAFIGIGLFLLYLADSLHAQCGITPPKYFISHSDDDARSPATESTA